MKRLLFSAAILLFSLQASAQSQNINWLSAEQLTTRFKKEQKPILVFLNTSWCKFCRMQESTSFTDSLVVTELNKNYYAFKLDAESKQIQNFFGKEYGFNSDGGFHELAIYLGSSEGKLEFPTTILLNQRLEPIFKKHALVNIEEMRKVLNK